MRQDLYRNAGAIVAGAVALLGAAAATHVLVSLPIAGNKGAEWLGAFGTIGTLVGTIVLATRESRRHARDELVRAKLHGVGLMLRLMQTKRDIEHAIEEIEVPGAATPKALKADVWLKGIEPWTTGDLVPPIPLPNDAAVHLALAAGQLRTSSRYIAEVLNTAHPNFHQAPKVQQIVNILGFAKVNVGKALDECSDIYFEKMLRDNPQLAGLDVAS